MKKLLNRLSDWWHNRLRLRGLIFKGYGEASKTLKYQLPHFKKCLPDLENYHLATINVMLEKPVQFNGYAAVTPWLKWKKDYPPESFLFVACEIETKHNRCRAFIYIPSNSPHTASCHKWEVIAEESLPFITTGEEITLIFDYPHYSTKYAACIGGETRI